MKATTFSWLDYLLFVFMLIISALVGVYYGFIKKQNTAHDYLLGGKRMSILPTSMSIISSGISGVTLLSVPADIYRYGVSYGFNVLALLPLGLLSYYVFLPVFYKLQVTSTYEYFNIRFNYQVRVFASLLFIVNLLLFLPIVIYIPALALEQVTDINIHLITPIVCAVCIFYTTLGGLRAVVSTDAIQFVIMLLSLITVIVLGTWHGGGLSTIIESARKGGRLDISFDFDFLKRDTFWACAFGQFFHMLASFPVNQGFVQKLLSLPSFNAIKITIIWSMIGFMLLSSLSIFSGLIMFNKYMTCDPVQANVIKNHDQILPLFVMEEISFVPGLCGLFISGIFSAGLSTLSAILNCLAAIIYEDFVSPFVSENTSQERISQYLKLIVVVIGLFSTGCVFIVEKLGSLVALTLSFAGVTGGPILGLFCVGMLLPKINAKGALIGGIASFGIMIWIVMTSQWHKINGHITYPILPVSITGCNETITNITNKVALHNVSNTNIPGFEEPFVLYRVSFYWYASMGFTILVIVASIISSFTKEDKPVNKDCISPIAHFLIKKGRRTPPDFNDLCLEKLNK